MPRRKINTDLWLSIAEAVSVQIKSSPGLNTTKLRDLVAGSVSAAVWDVRQVMSDMEEAGTARTITPHPGKIYASTHWYPGKKTP